MTAPPETLDPPADLDEVVAGYLNAAEAGRPPDRAALLARHPALADDLAEFFAGLDQVERLAAPLRAAHANAASGDDTVDASGRTAPYRPVPTETPPPLGDLPGYELLDILGRGGMGVVFKARHLTLKRLVALKVMRAGDLADDAERARFRVEAEAVAQLQHPNIVQIYEVGEHRGQPYCALEFVAGGNLAERLDGKPQRPGDAAGLARTLAEAMAAAHRRNVIHRDLKPANVLLTEDGVPKVTDFGLAKKLDDDHGQTRTGAVMGTPAYMAPEQALGRKEVGPLADVYSLGAILYELLTGRPPFRGETVLETLDLVRTKDPVPVRLLEPKVPRDLETICLKCLEKDPRKRYASAEALADDLGRFLAGEPIQARRSGPLERAYRWVRRNPVVAALGSLLALAFLVGFVVVAWQLGQTRAALAEAKANLYFQRVNSADREAQAGNTDRADVLLELCPPELRHWEWYYLKRRCQVSWMQLAGHTDQVRCVAYNTDGTRLASCGNDGTVRIWNVASGHELAVLRGHLGWLNCVLFLPDGKRLLSSTDTGKLVVWDAASGHLLSTRPMGIGLGKVSPDGKLWSIQSGTGLKIVDIEADRDVVTIPGRLPPHGKAIAFDPARNVLGAALNGHLSIWDMATGKEDHRLHAALPNGSYCLEFSPDGKRLYTSQHIDQYPSLKVWDTTTGREIPAAFSTPLTVSVLALSPDGTSIATGGHEGFIKIRHVLTGQDLRATRSFQAPIVSLAFSPTSHALAVASGKEVWVRDWSDRQQDLPTLYEEAGRPVASIAYHPDGRLLASCGDGPSVTLWDSQRQRSVRTFTAPVQAFTQVRFSRSGQRLLGVGRDGAVYIWDAESGHLGPTIRLAGSEIREADFSPDGTRLVTASNDCTVRIWGCETGEEQRLFAGHESGVWSARFSPDGGRVASGSSDATVRLWDVQTGLELICCRGHTSHVQRVVFSPDGRTVASGSADESIRIWDTATRHELAQLRGHTSSLRELCFTPDGQRLASAGDDGTVRIWDTRYGQEVLSVTNSRHGKVRWVAFRPDGSELASAFSTGAITLQQGPIPTE